MLQKIQAAKHTYKQVENYAKRMDTYGFDMIIGLIPWAGDLIMGTISTIFFLYHAAQVDLAQKDIMKILWYQAWDLLIGAIPVLGDIWDFFFKANRKSALIFKKHLDKLTNEAVKSWELIVNN
jgi:hypothetical protein